MYLDRLVVKSVDGVVRDIPFRSGLNLVVDTTTKRSTDSGNNVGKTTFLRVVDFCFGGRKEEIYVDKEFKIANEAIVNFLNAKKVFFELTLKTINGLEIKIVRPIVGKSSIDGTEYSSSAKFREALQETLFGYAGGRPTLRQLMNKFIRIEEHQVTKTLYFLANFVDHTEYEALFMFLFGFKNNELLGEKKRISDKIKKTRGRIKDSSHSVEELEQQVSLIDDEISELEDLREEFNFQEGVETELGKLKTIQGEVQRLKDSIAKLAVKIENSKLALGQLANSKTTVNSDSIKVLYEQADANLAKLDVKFGEVVDFHNQMVGNKIEYVKKSLRPLEKDISVQRKKLKKHLATEAKLLTIMSDAGALGEYDKLNLRLQEKSRQKGNKEGLIEILEGISSEMSFSLKKMERLNSEMGKYEKTFKANLTKFNKTFSKLSKQLYGEEYYLYCNRTNNKTTDNYLLQIGNLKENVGTGKKKAQISALDLSYLKFAEDEKYRVPYFVLHDQLETVFENQLKTLFDLANSMSGQFVVSVLSDKLHEIEAGKVRQSTILTLSQSEKFFKIP